MSRFGWGKDQYLDNNGKPLSGGKLYFYETATTTRKTTYSDNEQSIPNAHPVVLDAAGRQPDIFFEGAARLVVTNSAGVQIDVADPVYSLSDSGGTANPGIDPFYWKPEGQPLFGYCTGQSLTEPSYPPHPDGVPLTACEGVLIWRSDGEDDNWDFYPFDPDIPLSNDFRQYDATTNPNGRTWSLNGDGDLVWDEPYTGYAGGGFLTWFIGLAIQFYETTRRKVYIGNTAWGGRSSFQWLPGYSIGDSLGQCTAQIDYHMPLMQARLAELEPELDNYLWDFFAFNQSSTDAGIEAYGYPPETYVTNWSAFFDYTGATTLDGYGQAIPSKYYDPSKCMIAMLERTKRDENYPQWNGQEMLLLAYGGLMQMITSAKRLIWDTEGPDGSPGTLPGDPAYDLHFWGDVCVDFGRDAARQLISNGCGKARTEIQFLRHNTSTKPIKGTYTFSSSTLGGIADPGTGNIGTQSTTHVSVSKTDTYGDTIPFEDIETGDILYMFNRNDRTEYFSATVNAITLSADYVGFTVSSFTAGWTPSLTYVVDVEVNRRVYLTETTDGETTYFADVLHQDPYKRVGINYANGTMPNATYSIKAHDEVGLALHLESFVDDINRMGFNVYLRDTVGKIFAEFTNSASIVFRGDANTIDTLDTTTGENKPAITFANGFPLVNNGVYGSIRAVSNATAIALSGTTAATAMWNTNGNANGVTVDEATGSITVFVAGRYRIYLGIQSGTTTANERTAVYISVNGTPSTYLGVIMSIGSVYFNSVSVEGTFPLSANDVIDVDFLPLGAATTITVANAELYVELLEIA